MTGWPDLNHPAFYKKQTELESRGFTVQNPADNQIEDNEDWHFYIRLGVRQLLQCRNIYMLKDWELSRGARIELNLARDFDMPVFFEGIEIDLSKVRLV